MLDLRKRIFIGTSVVVFIILAVVLFVIVLRRDTAPDTQVPDTSTPPIDEFFDPTLNLPPVVGNPDESSPTLIQEDTGERYVRQLAINMVERFGSYSNQNRNAHIDDVLPLLTPGMATWVSSQGQVYSDQYVGASTKVIVSRVEAFSDTSATVHVEVQQRRETQTETERIYRTGNVELINEGSGWKVSGLFWE
jgi:hypothetical protein